jgi:RNA polymerase sigma-70 factor (ECF subfamily)
LEGDTVNEQVLPQPDPEQGRRLRQALAGLPDRQRSAVLLHEWMGYSFREIGAALGISEATARVHAHRGREALRAVLQDTATDVSPVRMQEQGS